MPNLGRGSLGIRITESICSIPRRRDSSMKLTPRLLDLGRVIDRDALRVESKFDEK